MKNIITNVKPFNGEKLEENQYFAAYRSDFRVWENGMPCTRPGYIQTSKGEIYVTKNGRARLIGHTDFNCVVEVEPTDKLYIVKE